MPKKNEIEFDEKHALMMVEPRNKDLETILESVEKQIEPEWEFYFFGSSENEGAAKNWFRNNSKRKLHFLKYQKNS